MPYLPRLADTFRDMTAGKAFEKSVRATAAEAIRAAQRIDDRELGAGFGKAGEAAGCRRLSTRFGSDPHPVATHGDSNLAWCHGSHVGQRGSNRLAVRRVEDGALPGPKDNR